MTDLARTDSESLLRNALERLVSAVSYLNTRWAVAGPVERGDNWKSMVTAMDDGRRVLDSTRDPKPLQCAHTWYDSLDAVWDRCGLPTGHRGQHRAAYTIKYGSFLEAATVVAERLACDHMGVEVDPECARCEWMAPFRKALAALTHSDPTATLAPVDREEPSAGRVGHRRSAGSGSSPSTGGAEQPTTHAVIVDFWNDRGHLSPHIELRCTCGEWRHRFAVGPHPLTRLLDALEREHPEATEAG